MQITQSTTSRGWKLLIFVKFETKHLLILMFKHPFHSQYQWFDRLIKQVKNDNSHDQQAKG